MTDLMTNYPHGINLLQSSLLSSYPEILHGQSTRKGGFSTGGYEGLNLGLNTGDDREIVLQNRAVWSSSLGFSLDSVYYAGQVHGTHVESVDAEHYESGIRFSHQTDALITNLRNVPLVILTADCIPVIIYDPVSRAVGAVHAGWKGSFGRITAITLNEMNRKYGTEAKDCRVWIAAGICNRCYEVSPELADTFKNEFGDRVVNGRLLNLPRVNQIQLIESGVIPENISMTKQCTYENKVDFYSHRRDNTSAGRLASFIMLR